MNHQFVQLERDVYEQLREYKSDSNADGGKAYPFSYSYTYTGSQAGSIEIANGLIPSYCKIHILGPCANPQWMLYQGGSRIHQGKVNRTIQSGNKLVINSDPAKMEIAEYTATGEFIADRYADSDFTTERLFQLPAGNCKIVFSHDGQDIITGWVEVKKLV